MSWVTDVLLLFNLAEEYDEDEQLLDTIPPLDGINGWLESQDYGELNCLDEHARGGGKAMQAFVYGGAFNRLDIEKFLKVVRAQKWMEPENVQILLQDEDESRFTLYTIEDG